MKRFLTSAVVMLSVLSVSGAYAADVIEKSVVGNPELKSINVISFAPEGVLLIGDGAAAQIVAIETEDTSPAKALPKKLPTIQKLIAGHIGAKADGIEILDLAVNPASGRAYIAIRKQDDKSYIIVTVDGSGEVREFELDNVKYARVQLSAGKVKVSRITDVAWGDDRVIAAGRSNETFSSKIFSIDAPLEHEAKGNSFSAETYHVSHGKWETKAPMSVVIPFKENGKTYVVGAYSCTPIVKYPIDSLKPGAQVKGESVLELGSGNTAIDMFIYTKDGKPYVLANTFRFHHARKPFGPSPYWTVKFEQGILAEDANVNEKALRRLKGYEPATERVAMVEAYHGVRQMDKLGDSNALVMREGSDGLSLEVLVLP